QRGAAIRRDRAPGADHQGGANAPPRIHVQAVPAIVRDGSRTPLGDFYARKRREKGAGKAICATARKLLALVFVLLTKGLDDWFLEERLYQRKLRMLAAAN